MLNYRVTGSSTQIFNLSNMPLKNIDLSLTVIIDGNVKAEGNGWYMSPDGTWITVTGATSNVNISFYRLMPTS
jgi:hypothetical protein